MPETKLIVAEISEKNGWLNIKTNDGKEVSVMIEKAPKTTAQLKVNGILVNPGSEVTGNLTEKGEKLYMWDLDEKKGGGKGFAPKDKGFDAAIAAVNAAASMYALQKDVPMQTVLNTAESFHQFIMSKSTKPATETK